MSARTIFSANGTTVQPIKLKTKVSIGATRNKVPLEVAGIVVSLTNNFRPSAKGCSKPTNPITLGPLRLWMIPMILRSAIVKYATEINKGMIISKIFNRIVRVSLIIFDTKLKSGLNRYLKICNLTH